MNFRTNYKIFPPVYAGILLICLAHGKETLKSQVFFGEIPVEVRPTTDFPYISVFSEDSFQVPTFEFSDSVIKKSVSSASWLHIARSKDGKKESQISSCFFLPAISREFQTYRTHLPVVIIDCADTPSIDSHDYQDCFWGVMIPENEKIFPGQCKYSGKGGVRRRGASSRRARKLPLRLEFQNWKGKDKPQQILDFPASSDWILSPPSLKDPSLIRNALMYALSRDCGQYAPRTAFVEVFLNSNGKMLDMRSDYLGVYTLTEKIEASAGRVSLFPESDEDARSKLFPEGVIFKYDRPGPGQFGVPLSEFERSVYLVEPREEKATYQQVAVFQRHMDQFAKAIKPSPKDSAKLTHKSYQDFIDPESWHTWLWLGELSRDVDLYRASSYFHIPATGPQAGLIKAGPVWDFDRSINSLDKRNKNPEGWTAGDSWLPNLDKGEAPWWWFLLENPDFRKEHCLHWQKLREGPLKLENIFSHLDAFEGELLRVNHVPEGMVGVFPTSPFVRNSKKWPGSVTRGQGLEAEVQSMKTWLEHRLLWLDGQVAQVLKDLD